jgi:hypothetical protein
MYRLFERLRIRRQAGRVTAVVAFRGAIREDLGPLLGTPELGNRISELSNSGMAEQLEQAARAHPEAIILGYIGSLHVSLDTDSNFGIRSAAARLPRGQTVTVYVDGRGAAWNGIGNDYGPHDVSSRTNLCQADSRVVTLPTDRSMLPGFDAIACTGKAFTASPPATANGSR